MENQTVKLPSPIISLVPILVLVSLLFVTIRTFGSDALNGGSQISLLATTAVCSLIAMSVSKVRWKTIETAIVNNITGVASALLILLIIGSISGSWMISGVVPTLIYYGTKLIHPTFFLVSTCVICAIVSVMTGSSWTTIATIGIALLGIGRAQGYDEGWIAGAIISGAYFGDKISPPFGHYGASLVHYGYSALHSYPLYVDYNRSVDDHHVGFIHHYRILSYRFIRGSDGPVFAVS